MGDKKKSDAEAKAKVDADAKAEAEAKTKAEADAKAKAAADAKAKAEADAKAKAAADAKAKAEAVKQKGLKEYFIIDGTVETGDDVFRPGDKIKLSEQDAKTLKALGRIE